MHLLKNTEGKRSSCWLEFYLPFHLSAQRWRRIHIFFFFRLLGGIGIGISSVAAPTYISEISTAQSRGRLVAMYQFNIVFGILIAYLSNYFLEGIGGENDWRLMLGVMTVPSLIYSLMVFTIPESPRWLISNKGDIEGAKAVMMRLGLEGVDALLKGNTVDGSQLTDNRQQSTVNNQPFISKNTSASSDSHS